MPDVIPSAKPFIKDVAATENDYLEVQWIANEDPDLKGYNIYRERQNDSLDRKKQLKNNPIVMHIKNFILLVLCILLATAQLQAQDENNTGTNDENKEERASGMLKELFEFRIAKDALRIYNLTNVDKSWTLNGELRDSIIGFWELAGINFLLRDTMACDHFWAFICNGGGYKTQEDPPKGTERKYNVEIHPSMPDNDDINKTDFKEATNNPLTDVKLSFADNQNNEYNRAKKKPYGELKKL